MKKFLAIMFSIVLVASMASACGSNNSASPTPTVTPTEDVTISMFLWEDVKTKWDEVSAGFKELYPNITVEENLVAGSDDEIMKKIDVSLLAGDTTDVIILKNPTFTAKYTSAGLLEPLDSYATDQGLDLQKVFGNYLNRTGEQTLSVPIGMSTNILYFNKKIFDDANVAYPTSGMTWDQYVELAEKVTDTGKGKYGSYMQPWPHYYYMTANQRGANAYSADGKSSNMNDQKFKDALKFYNDLSQVYKVQPSKAEMVANKFDWDAFASGKFAMNVVGTWQLGILADKKSYPRDWSYGVVAMPSPEDGKNMVTAMTSAGVNKNSKHKDAAAKLSFYLAQNMYKTKWGVLPPIANLTDDEYKATLQSLADSSNGEVTSEDLYNAIYNSGLGASPEQITGTAASQMADLLNKEAEKYLYGKQSLDDTLNNVKSQHDTFISSELNQ